MRPPAPAPRKTALHVVSRATLSRRLAEFRRNRERIVFTNGCFDLLHAGHVRYLRAARRMGDRLIVGVNTDASVRRLEKAPGRPIVGEDDRAEVLAALEMVDLVILFDEDTPESLIRAVRPDVLVKGGDWSAERIVGSEFVRSYGGRVKSIRFEAGYSTTSIVEKIRHIRT